MNWWIRFFYFMIGIIIVISSGLKNSFFAFFAFIPIFICVILIVELTERQTLKKRNKRVMKIVLNNKEVVPNETM